MRGRHQEDLLTRVSTETMMERYSGLMCACAVKEWNAVDERVRSKEWEELQRVESSGYLGCGVVIAVL